MARTPKAPPNASSPHSRTSGNELAVPGSSFSATSASARSGDRCRRLALDHLGDFHFFAGRPNGDDWRLLQLGDDYRFLGLLDFHGDLGLESQNGCLW